MRADRFHAAGIIPINNLYGAAMKKNMGQTDRTVRALLGAVMLVFAIIFQEFIGLIGLVLLGTAAIGYCPMYTILGISTNKYGE